MSYGKIAKQLMTNIADAIREKTSGAAAMTAEEMASTIKAANLSLQEKTVTPTTTEQTVTSDADYYGLSSVTVAAMEELPAAEDYSFGSVETNTMLIVSGGYSTTGTTQYNTLGYLITPVEPVAIYGIYRESNHYYTRLWGPDKTVIADFSKYNNTSNDVFFEKPINLTVGETYALTYMPVQEAGSKDGRIIEDSRVNVWNAYHEDYDVFPQKAYAGLYMVYSGFNAILGPAVSDSAGYYSGNAEHGKYEVQLDTMDSITNEVMRITGTSHALTPAEIITALQSVPVQTA